MKTWLCIEDGEQFTIKAETLEVAREIASMWNAEVIGEVQD